MWYLAAALFLFHAIGMLIDEAWYHRRRNLPAWERWGHPLDSAAFLLCLILALTLPATGPQLAIYLPCAIVSCLCITKDEWIHAQFCSGGEQWLHACLFILHPILLTLTGALMLGLGGDFSGQPFFRTFLKSQTTATALFMIYQILYWNGPWKRTWPSQK